MNLQAEIKKLIDSGEKPQRAVAIAYSMQLKKAQLGTTVEQDPNANYYDNNAPYFSNKRSGASDGYFFGAKSKAEEQARFYEAIYNQDYSGVPSDSMLANDTKHQDYSGVPSDSMLANDTKHQDVKIYNEFQAQPQQGVQLDLSDNESTATNMDIYKNPEQLQRMQRNKVYNTATNNYDENGNAINTDDYSNKDYYSKLNIYNPYGGIGLDQAIRYGGEGFGNKKPGQAALGTGLSLLKGARGFLSGYSSAKASRESAESSYKQQFRPNTNPVYLSQEGGTISNAEEMTGAYLTETEEAPTVELEKDEFTLNSQTGEIQKVVGEKHTNGGVKSDLPAGSQVLSNYTKIGAKTAKELKEMFDISVKPKDTFAKVMDKIDAKIGYKETIEEETEYLKTLEKQQTLDTNDATKKLNEQHLAKELKENEEKKSELEDKRVEAFQTLFQEQESRPKKGDGTEVLKKEGGNVYDPNVLNLAKQYNLSPDRVIELMQQGGRVPMYQEAGTTPTESDLYGDEYENELINKYGAKQFTREGYSQGVPAQQPTAEAQQAPVAEEKVANFDPNSARDTWVAKTGMDWSEAKRLNAPSRMRIRQEGGVQNEEVNGHLYSLKNGADPRQVVAYLIESGMSQEEASQLVQSTLQQMQGQFPQEEQMEGQMSNPQEEAQEPQMKEGGKLPVYQEGTGYTFSTRTTPKLEGYETEGVSILDQDSLSDVELMQSYTGKGYGAKMADVEKTMDIHKWYFDTDEKKKAFREAVLKKGEQPEVRMFQEAYNNEIENRAIRAGVPEQDVKKIVQDVGFSKEGVKKLDGLFGAFTSTRPLYNFSKKDGKIEVTPTEVDPTTNQPVRGKDLGAKTVMANLPQDLLLPPSSLARLYKGEVRFGELDPTKMSAKAQNVEAERQRQTAAKELYFLNPQQRAALMASGLGQTQMATNQAIGQAEMFNAQQKQQVDQFNLQNNMKEDLTNIELNQDFERRNLAGQGKYEANMRGFYNNFNAIQRQNFADVRDLNLANAAFDKYQTDGSNIMFMPSDTVLNSQGTMKGITKEQYDKMTDAQKQAFLANAVYAPKKNA